MGDWHKEKMKCEGYERSILKILKNRWQSKCVTLIGFGEVNTSEESQYEDLRLR